MPALTVRKTWLVNGTLTNPTSMTLVSLVENDNSALIASNVAMTEVSTGVFEYANANVSGTTFTATVSVVYAGQTYTDSFVASAEAAAADATPVSPTALDQQIDLNELLAFRKQLRAIVYGGALAVSVDGMRVNMDINEARRSLREVEAQIAVYNGLAPARPVVLCVSMAGNYSDDNSSTTTEQT